MEIFLDVAAKAVEGEILCADGEPVSVGGIIEEEPGHFVTFFQATEAFDEHSWEITERLLARSEARPHQVFIYSSLVHPKSERWFRVLGYKRDEWSGVTAAGWPLYRFRRD